MSDQKLREWGIVGEGKYSNPIIAVGPAMEKGSVARVRELLPDQNDDAERLNWMIKHGARVSQVFGPQFQVIANYGYYKGPLCDSAREAIDKAMEERP